MKLTYLYAGNDGESHFQEVTLPEGNPERRITSAPIPATQFTMGESAALAPQDWHHAPRRQLVVVLSGAIEVEVGDGSRKRFGPGDSFIADDLAGRGHLTRDLEGPMRMLYIHLPAGLDFSALA